MSRVLARTGADLSAELRRLALEHPASVDCEGATQVVPGVGAPDAALMLVGEAPGEREDREGLPFVGRSGQLLDAILAEAGLDRAALYVTNAVKCRPVRFEGHRKRNRAPRAGEVKAWAPVLAAELSLVRPKVVVGLGAVAGRALVDPDFKITRQRGRWFTERSSGLPVIVTWHPAYILRQQGDEYAARLAEAVADFRTAGARLSS